jgi:hypothetical protein
MRPITRVGIVGLLVAALAVPGAAATLERIGALSVPGATDSIKKSVEEKGYRVVLDDGWTADFWFSRALATTSSEAAGALYPQLVNGEFVAVVNFSKGSSDFRGQAVPAGAYTLRYQYIPQDANHMGVTANPDFLLAIPLSADSDPTENLAFQRLVSLSAKTTGSAHPAVIALAPASSNRGVTIADGMTILTVEVQISSGKTLELGIVLKGQASQARETPVGAPALTSMAWCSSPCGAAPAVAKGRGNPWWRDRS